VLEMGVNPEKSFFIYAKQHCPRRSLEASKLYKYLIKNRLYPVDDLKQADYILIYTCGGFETDEEFSILTVEKVLKEKKESAKVIVTGCLPSINPKKLEDYDVSYIIEANDIEKLDDMIHAEVPYAKCPDTSIVYGIHDLYHGPLIQRIKRHSGLNTKLLRVTINSLQQKVLKPSADISKNTYRIEIAKGCLGACSYCAIKLAMPKFKSFPEEKIIDSFKYGLENGYRNFALIAGDIGCYGMDIGTNLPNLLKKLLAIKGDYKITLVDLNARWLGKYFPDFLSVLKENPEKVTRLILPIQSGSNRILKLMHRNYDIDEVKKYVLDLQKSVPKLMIETHILVGFPGETDEDFQKSVELVKEVHFSKVEVYQYEDRPGTEASTLPNKVPKKVMKAREKILARKAKTVRVNYT
jgi:threonylcarbamoyladenosine tRNA methylthiotransferase CDKAL1